MLSDDATKRLNAIEQHSELGSGLNIAMKDLDIRGAGDLLGASQSGYINEIGFSTYQKILNETINELKNNEFKELFKDEKNDKIFRIEDFQIETDLELLIPDTYVNNIAERLSLYQDLEQIKTKVELKKYASNLKDRFGDVPQETSELLKTIELKWMAKEIGFQKIVLKQEKMICYFPAGNQADYFESESFTNVLIYIQSNPKNCKMSEKNSKLRLIYSSIKTIEQAIENVKNIKISIPS
jgi:transcription-repair coupling factor (superfamily II helicase)